MSVIMRKIFDWTLTIFLGLSPLFLFRDYKPSLSRGLFFIVGSLILFFISNSLEKKREFKNIWISLFLIWMLIRCFFDGIIIGPEEWFNFWYSMAGFLYVLCAFILFHTVYCYVDNIKKFFYPILFVCLVNVPLVLCQHFQYDFFWTKVARFNPVCGFFDMPQQLSQYAALSTPILYYLNPFLLIIPAIFLILSKEISAFFAVFLGSMFYLFIRNKKKLIIFVLILMTVLFIKCIGYVHMKWYTRPIMWGQVLEHILRKPYLGYGYQSFNDVIVGNKQKIGSVQNPGAFNDYLHTIFEFGLPALFFIGMFIVEYFKKFFKIRGRTFLLTCLGTSVFIGLMNMFGQGLIRYASASSLFIVLLAFFCIKTEEEYECHIN